MHDAADYLVVVVVLSFGDGGETINEMDRKEAACLIDDDVIVDRRAYSNNGLNLE